MAKWTHWLDSRSYWINNGLSHGRDDRPPLCPLLPCAWALRGPERGCARLVGEFGIGAAGGSWMSGVTRPRGDGLDVMREMEGGSVDAVVTDPPYSSGTRQA